MKHAKGYIQGCFHSWIYKYRYNVHRIGTSSWSKLIKYERYKKWTRWEAAGAKLRETNELPVFVVEEMESELGTGRGGVGAR